MSPYLVLETLAIHIVWFGLLQFPGEFKASPGIIALNHDRVRAILVQGNLHGCGALYLRCCIYGPPVLLWVDLSRRS